MSELSVSLMVGASEMLNAAAGCENPTHPSGGGFNDEYTVNAGNFIETSQSENIEEIHKLGVAFRLCDNFSMSEMCYRRALDLSIEASGFESLETARHRNFLAGVLFATHRFDQCIEQLLLAVAIYDRSLGIDHIYARLSRFALALCYSALGDDCKASRYYGQTGLKEMLSDSFVDAPGKSTLLPRLVAIAAIKFEQGALEDSFELFRFCVIQEANEAWPGNPMLAKVFGQLSVLCRSQGMARDAQEFASMSEQIRQHTPIRAH